MTNINMEILERKDRLQGVGVALVTPFDKNGEIDVPALIRLVDYVTEGGVDFIVALGTTGENPVLSHEEKLRVLDIIAEANRQRLPLVIGLGGNNTAEIQRKLGEDIVRQYDYILSVAPYYNRPTQKGLLEHYIRIAQSSPKPVIVYNIPSRTGVNINADTLMKMTESCPNIVGVKEASASLVQISDILQSRPSHFSVFSGDDALTFPVMCLGGDGVISTSANLLPASLKKIVRSVQEGRWEEARNEHFRILKLIRMFFEQGNPAGIKAGLHVRNLCENVLRLPLCPVDEDLYRRIASALQQL